MGERRQYWLVEARRVGEVGGSRPPDVWALSYPITETISARRVAHDFDEMLCSDWTVIKVAAVTPDHWDTFDVVPSQLNLRRPADG